MSVHSLSPSPYYLAFAVGGRPNACYSPPSPPAATTPAAPLDLPTLPPPVASPPPSPPLSSTSPSDPLPLPLKSSLVLTKDSPSPSDSLYAKELSDSLPPPLLSPPPPPPPPSFPSHRVRGGFGQDAWYIDSAAGSQLHSFGVADGVGGWRSQGVDSGIISRAVMEKCQQLAVRYRHAMASSTHSASVEGGLRRWPLKAEAGLEPQSLPFSLPSHLLAKAYAAVKEEKVVTAGSTTACVLTVTPYRCGEKPSPALSGMDVDELGSGEADPRSPPPSPRDFDSRQQLTAEDEHKELHARPFSNPVPVPTPAPSPSFMDSDSDDDDGVDASFTTHISPPAAAATTDNTPSSSLSSKTASAFWSAVGVVMTPPTSTSQPSSAASTPSLPASPMTSPPPSRPPSPSSPPLFLSCASLGDSGFLLLRHQRVIHRSDIQRTGRIVKQLAIIPPHLSGPQHRYCDDSPADAALSSHRIQEGDVIIVGSDGLLDNLCSSWPAMGLGGASAGFFVPWGRFLLGGVGGEDDNDKELLEKQNRRVESVVKECAIDWEAREPEAAGDGSGGSGRAAGGQQDGFVRLLCDRLVAEASEFMGTAEGKPDDLTVLVLQVGKTR